MRVYQFCAVTHAGHNTAEQDILCFNDTEAMLLAKNMLIGFRSVEVWLEARLVGSAPVSHVARMP